MTVRVVARQFLVAAVAGWLGAGWLALPQVAWAGHQFFRNQAVGGISIDAAGLVKDAEPAGQAMLLAELRKQVKRPASELNQPVGLRMVSLKGLEAACQHALEHNLGQLPDEVRYLAGIQRIKYVFVYPEQNDIVLAGPGEGWQVDNNANVVGITTGKPVLLLDDLLAAFRFAAGREGVISCSIDPTEQGYQRLLQLLDQQRASGRRLTPGFTEQMAEAFGPQQITIHGVPTSSHFARVLVAADYKMKRLAMKLDPSPVRGLTSWVDMMQGGRGKANNVNPRWWLACNYQPLAKTPDGLAWEIRGDGVKALTEDEFVTAEGKVQGTGRVNPTAKRWADTLTRKYDELSQHDPVFGELRNLMDLSVVAALIQKHDLWGRAGHQCSLLTAADSVLGLDTWHTPKTVQPQCNMIPSGKGWTVTASGGVQLEPFQVIAQTTADPAIEETRDLASRSRQAAWWWNK